MTLALVVLTSAFAPVGLVSAQSVSIEQTATSGATVAPGGTVTLEATLTVTDANSPAIDADLPAGWTIQSQSATPGTATYKDSESQWLWFAGDDDGVNGIYQVTYVVSVPDDAAEGDYEVTADGLGIEPAISDGLSDSTATTITVATNDPPNADAGADQTVDEGSSISLDASGSSDPDGDSLSYSWTKTGGPDDVTLADANTATPSFDAPDEPQQAQTYTFAVEVSDGQATATDSVSVTVQPVNDPPTADAGSDQTVEEGSTVQLPGSGSDVDDESLAYSWTQTGGPPVSLSDASASTPSFTAPSVDSATALTFELTVSDGENAVTDAVTVTVQPSAESPSAAFAYSPSGPETGAQVSFDASDSTDADGSIVSYEWDFDGDGQPDATGQQVTHTFDAAGDHDVTLTVTDDDGLTGSAVQTVAVSSAATDQPPTADFTVTPSSPAPGEQVAFDGSASGDDGSIASYEWTIDAVDAGGPAETTLIESDFESGSLSTDGWTHDAMGSDASAGANDATSNSGSQSAFHHGGEGAVVSPALDASGADSLTISYWVQKGSDSFSENPDAGTGEDLVVEYLDADGDWVEVDRIEDSVEPGAEFAQSLTVDDAGALHDGFQLRFRQEGASVASGDYWHVDDASVTASSEAAPDAVQKSGQTVSHTFGHPGVYDVTLTVTDDDGETDALTKTISVEQQQETTIPEAVAGQDGTISTAEIQQAISWWVTDEPVPGTGGETIDTQTMQQLIDAWVQDETVGGGSQ